MGPPCCRGTPHVPATWIQNTYRACKYCVGMMCTWTKSRFRPSRHHLPLSPSTSAGNGRRRATGARHVVRWPAGSERKRSQESGKLSKLGKGTWRKMQRQGAKVTASSGNPCLAVPCIRRPQFLEKGKGRLAQRFPGIHAHSTRVLTVGLAMAPAEPLAPIWPEVHRVTARPRWTCFNNLARPGYAAIALHLLLGRPLFFFPPPSRRQPASSCPVLPLQAQFLRIVSGDQANHRPRGSSTVTRRETTKDKPETLIGPFRPSTPRPSQ